MSAENLKYHSTHSKNSSCNPHVSKCIYRRNGCQYSCRFVLQTVSFISVPNTACVAEFLGWGRLSMRQNCRDQCGAKTGTVRSQVHGQLRGVRPTALNKLKLLLEGIQTLRLRWIHLQLAQWPCTVYRCYINMNVTAPRNTSNSSTPNIISLLNQRYTNPECHLARANKIFYRVA